MISLVPLGDRAWLARFASLDDARRWAEAARSRAPTLGITDVVLAYDAVAIYVDPPRADPESLVATFRDINPAVTPGVPGAIVRLPVYYDGPDLDAVAQHFALRVDEVVAIHSSGTYTIQAIGFRPGFPYAGPLPPALTGLARRASPRPRVDWGSVAIAGAQTCIYPETSPGGWHLLGRSPLRIVDPTRAHFPLRAGDILTFEPIDARKYQELAGELLPMPSRPIVERRLC